MAGEAKTHTQGEVEILVAVSEIRTMQIQLNSTFTAHTKDDDRHFKSLYDADRDILGEISKVPERLIECREDLKTEVLTVARREFTTITDFEVFKTTVITSVKVAVIAGTIVGSIAGTLITFFVKYVL